MDYFENIILKIIEGENKWVRQNVKVNLTKREKKKVGKATMPRPDIDIVAYKPLTNTIELWEIKSYLDSTGVKFKDLKMKASTQEGGYKILTSKKYQKIIIGRLTQDWVKQGLIQPKPKIKMALAAGKIKHGDEKQIREYFDKKGWILLAPSDIKKRLATLADLPYENDPYIITAKLIFRNR